MEGITDGVKKMNIEKKNIIQVSNTKKPLFFYVNLTKRYIQQHNEAELSGLGMAISTVVSIAEILKNNGFAVEKKITTSTVEIKDDSRGRVVQKAKMGKCSYVIANKFQNWRDGIEDIVVLGKTAKFDELMAAAQEAKDDGNRED